MVETEIRVETTDGQMTTFVAHPDGDEPIPVAVLFMDGVGYREQIKDRVREDQRRSPSCRRAEGVRRLLMGAQLALHAAASKSDEFAAAAGIHPSALVTDQTDSPHLELANVEGELYFAFTENDQSATAENVERFRTELERQGARGTVERLPATSHGFAMAHLPVYDPTAAEQHFQRTLDLWRRNLEHEEVVA